MQHPEHGPAANPPHWKPEAGLSGGPPRTELVLGRAGAHLGKEGCKGGGVQTEIDVLRDLREEDGYCLALQRGAGAGSAPRASQPLPCAQSNSMGSVEETVVQRSPVSLPATDPTPLLLTMASVISKMSAPAVW